MEIVQSIVGNVIKPIKEMVQKLVAHYTPEKVILFGSYAYGTPHLDSDIDLLIIKKTDARFIDRWTEVRRILSDPHRTIPLETFAFTPQELSERLQIGDEFVTEIIEKGKVLYAT